MSQQTIILPPGPLVLVHKGWQHGPKGSADGLHQFHAGKSRRSFDASIPVAKPLLSKSATKRVREERPRPQTTPGAAPGRTQDWLFVDATEPLRKRDPGVQKLVRRHVMKDYYGDPEAREKAKRPRIKSPTSSAGVASVLERDHRAMLKESLFSKNPPGSATSLYGGGLPFAIKPYFHKLMNFYISQIARVLYPLQDNMIFNPAHKFWFPLALTDEALFRALLYVSALGLTTLPGSKASASDDPTGLTRPLFGLLSQRLNDLSKVSDATIGAISCLAMVATMYGKKDEWSMHLKGMAEMIRIKGGLSAIPESLQNKLCRADVEGATDTLSMPYLEPLTRTQPAISSILPPIEVPPPSTDFLHILAFTNLDLPLLNIFVDISRFMETLNYAIDRSEISIHPRAFDEDAVLIQYDLLHLPEYDKSGTLEACRLGALLCIKSLTRATPFAPGSSATIVSKLKSALEGAPASDRLSYLDLWLLYTGGIASQGTPERAWFTYKLAELSQLEPELSSWISVRNVLRSSLWVESIHDGPCRQLWADVNDFRVTND
ncbi:uncharacterized protein BDZ99DRAFT_515230 [Mytilinidion resinicola]|uniref:Fungal-specific transcription factor domain-containing protein n=1 Tax=Mytilinidion resinicola TaxID=574789 RepID=A0A6A6Z6J0_9PEZI|nr:uncharacterized protein BDZ99DRAFT_515230 [Mytilinidion resinicola]KAF2816650.1 hypothetical protein BDZ99DRAFT_515230 [Mytilinidion resinicola]